MKRDVIRAIGTAAIALACAAPAIVGLTAEQGGQGGAAAATPADAPAGPVPRMADGRPDLSGVWWGGADVGAARGRGGGGRGGARGGGARGGTPPATFTSLYRPEAAAKAKTLSDKDDPTLRCVPTAFGTLNVSLYDVGAVGQIISTPKMVVMLTETYHGFRLIPTDGRPHRDDVPPAYRGESVGRWEGDTFVVDTRNFTDNTWMSAEGRVSHHSDQLRIVERYRRVDANTLEIEATVEDPGVLTAPWTVPKQTLVLAPFDRIMSLNCSGIETQALMDGAARQSTVK
ncbi:MAG TPA: hypothetical protein VFO58_19300 [Vicinamibacterales bacterium]|nr:hypothetical protein [Vicinamibacterales bacterium]